MRKGASEITYAEDFRWAESLDDAVARVVRDRLLAAPPVASVVNAPFTIDDSRDYDVTVRLVECEGFRTSPGSGSARFSATLEITASGPGHAVILRKTFIAPAAVWAPVSETGPAGSYDTLARLLGEAADALGREIASSLPEKQ